MQYNSLDAALIKKLKEIVGSENVITDPERIGDYSHDEFSQEEIRRMPEAVVKPLDTDQVCRVMRLANERCIPLTPRGGGTGLCGGCVPIFGGIVLSLEKMNRVIEVDVDNLMAVVEAGVTLRQFYAEIEGTGLFFPPHPGDESAMIGGLIATNAGGARAVKYGVIRNYIRGIELVLSDGTVTAIGGKLMKSSTGYSLLNLLIGSEGTLGIITRATISLTPPPEAMYTLVVPFAALEDAIKTVPLILKNRIIPMAVEFMDRAAISIAEHHLNKTWPCREGQAHLMFILDAPSTDELLRLSQKVAGICMANGALDVFVADERQKQKNILEIRSLIYEAMRAHMLEILDLTVPPAAIADFVGAVRAVERDFGTWLPTYGHAADGNVHIHIMQARWENGSWLSIDGWKEMYPAIRKRLHDVARSFDGIISGEHGIGLVKKEFMHAFLDRAQLSLMQSIKKAFDPHGILNPGKLFPD